MMSALFRWACSISILLSPRSVTGVSLSIGHEAFLFICLPGPSLLVPCSISIHVSPRLVTGGVRPFLLFLFICPPNLSLVVSALFHWSCSISMHLSPRSVTAGVRPFPLAMQDFYSFVSQVCYCWCPPFSAGHVAFLFMCLPGLSLVMSALFRWACSISILLSPRSVTGVSLSIGHEAFLFICLPGPSLLVPCSISIHVSPRPVTGDVRPFPLGMWHFYSFVSQVRHCWCHVAFLFMCLPGLSLVMSALFRWACSISILLSPRSVTGVSLSIGHEAFLFICLPGPSLLVP